MFFMFADEGGSLLGDAGGTPAAEGEAAPAEGEGDPDVVAEGWLTGSEATFANDPIMANVKDVPTLVKNYINAQRMVGKKGHMLPDENSGEDTWNEFYTKMGRPETGDDYGLQSEQLNEDFVKNFSAKAHEIGLMPRQAQALMEYYNESASNENSQDQEALRASEQASLELLKNEWGEGFNTKVHKAQVVAKQFGGESFIKALDEQGLGSNPEIIKFLANIGESLNEDSFEPSAVSQFAMTPEQAQAEIAGIMEAEDSPYWKPNHQDHFKVKQKVEKLYKIIS